MTGAARGAPGVTDVTAALHPHHEERKRNKEAGVEHRACTDSKDHDRHDGSHDPEPSQHATSSIGVRRLTHLGASLVRVGTCRLSSLLSTGVR